MAADSPTPDPQSGAVQYLMQRRRAHPLLEKPVHRLEMILGKPNDLTVAGAIAESLAELVLILNPVLQGLAAPLPVVAPPPAPVATKEPEPELEPEVKEEVLADATSTAKSTSKVFDAVTRQLKHLGREMSDLAEHVNKATSTRRDVGEALESGFVLSDAERKAIATYLEVVEEALFARGDIVSVRSIFE